MQGKIMQTTAIKRAVEIVGGGASLARYIGVNRASVQDWIRRGIVPATRAIEIEKATDGQVTRQELRPDLYPDESAA
jgi:DNA-binding transcriptional regulator YdaS (Cro superfamily)